MLCSCSPLSQNYKSFQKRQKGSLHLPHARTWGRSISLRAIIRSKATVRWVQGYTGLGARGTEKPLGPLSVCPMQHCHLVLVVSGHGPAEAPRKTPRNMRWLGLGPTASASSCLWPPHPFSHDVCWRQPLPKAPLRTILQPSPGDWALLVLPLWDTLPLHACLHLTHTSYY